MGSCIAQLSHFVGERTASFAFHVIVKDCVLNSTRREISSSGDEMIKAQRILETAFREQNALKSIAFIDKMFGL